MAGAGKAAAAAVEEKVPDPCSEVVDDSELAEDMVTTILARLSLPGLMRSRTACRAWDRAVSGPGVLRDRLQWRAGSGERMLFLVATSEVDGSFMSCVYDRASNRWYKLRLPEWLCTPRSIPYHPSQTEQLPWVSAGDGILLATATERAPQSGKPIIIAHIGNPVAGSWASLPAFPGKLDMMDVKGMLVDPIARCFKLVVARYRVQQVPAEEREMKTYVFDSAVGTWSKTTCALQVPELEFQPYFEGVFVGSVLYCITYIGNLLAYDLEAARWNFLDVSRPRLGPLELPLRIRYCSGPVNVRGRLLCLAVGEDRKNGVQVWELDPNLAERTWTVVATMAPPRLISQSFGRVWMRVVAGDDEVYFMERDHIVALDLRTTPSVWRRLPAWPYSRYTSFDRSTSQCLDPWVDFGSWTRQQ